MKRLFCSLMPSLKDERGHDFVYHSEVEKSLSIYPDIEFRAYIPKISEISKPRPSWILHFRVRGSFLKTIFVRTLDYFKIFRKKEPLDRAFFLESFDGGELVGIALASFFMKKRDMLLLFFRDGPSKSSAKRKFLFTLLQIVHLRLNDRFILLTDSERIPPLYGKRLNKPQIVLPIPHAERCLEKTYDSSFMKAYWPGKPRPTKGLEDINRLLNYKLPTSKKIELSLAEDSEIFPNNEIIIRRLPKILSRERYLEEISRSDIFLLPYDPMTYEVGTSGIFVEAIVAGKMAFVKGGSWLAGECERYNLRELIIDWNNPDLFFHIHDLWNDARVKEKVKEMQSAYLDFHNLENFGKKLHSIVNIKDELTIDNRDNPRRSI